ncbi:hypothetical protein [Streptomyces sp. NPDC053431]|uniref:hypothetical protein n=1 Tax=Streptomyces sp. NPDC053431 TaxID=3365703 RepID=UPI0037D5D4A3
MSNLPPPPPSPAEFRSRPDREARLAERALVLDVLGRRLLGIGRLTLFLVWLLLLEFGWGLVGIALAAFGGGGGADPLTLLFGLFCGIAGICALTPAVWMTVRGVLRDRVARERLVQWAVLDSDPPTDARLRAPVLSACWLLLSFALCATGLWASFAVAAHTTRDNGGYPLVVYGMGAGLGLWITGLIGLAKAVAHYRLAIRLTGRPGVRSTSSGLPRPE